MEQKLWEAHFINIDAHHTIFGLHKGHFIMMNWNFYINGSKIVYSKESHNSVINGEDRWSCIHRIVEIVQMVHINSLPIFEGYQKKFFGSDLYPGHGIADCEIKDLLSIKFEAACIEIVDQHLLLCFFKHKSTKSFTRTEHLRHSHDFSIGNVCPRHWPTG